jgi:hypothetical protein
MALSARSDEGKARGTRKRGLVEGTPNLLYFSRRFAFLFDLATAH